MERNLAAELDQLKDDFQAMKKLLIQHLPKVEPKVPPESREILTAENRETLNTLRDQMLAYSEIHNTTGAIAYTGTFSIGAGQAAQQSIWASLVPTDTLLALNDQSMVEKVLSSVGNGQRLAILLALLKKAMTVNQLMESLGSNTTGQVYHHLKPLVAADIIREEKGTYSIIPYRVQGLMMLLTGVWDLIDPHYTSGTWEA